MLFGGSWDQENINKTRTHKTSSSLSLSSSNHHSNYIWICYIITLRSLHFSFQQSMISHNVKRQMETSLIISHTNCLIHGLTASVNANPGKSAHTHSADGNGPCQLHELECCGSRMKALLSEWQELRTDRGSSMRSTRTSTMANNLMHPSEENSARSEARAGGRVQAWISRMKATCFIMPPDLSTSWICQWHFDTRKRDSFEVMVAKLSIKCCISSRWALVFFTLEPTYFIE